MTQHNDTRLEDFDDIRPYDDGQFKTKMASLVREPGFEHAVRYVMPDVDYPAFVQELLAVDTAHEFKSQIMKAFLEMLVARTTAGLSFDGIENFSGNGGCTFITNHRDIVLDAAFLNVCFLRSGLPLTQVAIGNNLLIYDWITDLVKLNGSFIVKRDTGVREALDAAKHLSGYIHYCTGTLGESVWIAQREGRAKDSNDRTQESVVKMLSLAGGGDSRANLMDINLTPVSISYEYDPNDYLKVREFLLRRRNPDYKKTQRDDLFSMETGLLGFKGRVHFHLGKCINDELALDTDPSRAAVVRHACDLLDRSIHCGYHFFPSNYIAYDIFNQTARYRAEYTREDVEKFEKYVASQLAKVDEPDITPEENEYMRSVFMSMYANPLKNQLSALDCATCD